MSLSPHAHVKKLGMAWQARAHPFAIPPLALPIFFLLHRHFPQTCECHITRKMKIAAVKTAKKDLFLAG